MTSHRFDQIVKNDVWFEPIASSTSDCEEWTKENAQAFGCLVFKTFDEKLNVKFQILNCRAANFLFVMFHFSIIHMYQKLSDWISKYWRFWNQLISQWLSLVFHPWSYLQSCSHFFPFLFFFMASMNRRHGRRGDVSVPQVVAVRTLECPVCYDEYGMIWTIRKIKTRKHKFTFCRKWKSCSNGVPVRSYTVQEVSDKSSSSFRKLCVVYNLPSKLEECICNQKVFQESFHFSRIPKNFALDTALEVLQAQPVQWVVNLYYYYGVDSCSDSKTIVSEIKLTRDLTGNRWKILWNKWEWVSCWVLRTWKKSRKRRRYHKNFQTFLSFFRQSSNFG